MSSTNTSRIFDLIGQEPPPEYQEYPSFAEFYPRHVISQLLREYNIDLEHEENFLWALDDAYTCFKAAHISLAVLPREVASKDTAQNAHKMLRDAVRILKSKNNGMEMRLRIATRMVHPENGLKLSIRDEEWFKLLSAAEALLAITKVAAELDGRKLKADQRSRCEFKAASAHLYDFWKDRLGRPASIQDRGGRQTRALKFILGCLRYMEPDIKESSIRGFQVRDG